MLPPRDLLTLVDFEIDEIRRALRTDDPIKVVEGRSQLRAIAAMEAAAQGEGSADVDLGRLEEELMGAGRDWRTIFPGVASISMSTEGNGLNVSIHITKTQGEPVRLVAKDSPEAAKAALVAVHKVAETSFYSLGFNDLAARTTPIGVSRGKLPAVIAHLKLKQDDSMFKRFQFGKLPVERYSKKALETLLAEIPKLEVPAVWAAYRKSLKKRS